MEEGMHTDVHLASLLDIDITTARNAMTACNQDFIKAVQSFYPYGLYSPRDAVQDCPAADSDAASSSTQSYSRDNPVADSQSPDSQSSYLAKPRVAVPASLPSASTLPASLPPSNHPVAEARARTPAPSLSDYPTATAVTANPEARMSTQTSLEAYIEAAATAADVLKRIRGTNHSMDDYMPSKRQCLMPLPPDLVLSGNANDPQAENPWCFQHHKLRGEQLKSLNWMINQEERAGLQGGVLGDKMGYGRIATTIALISMDKLKPLLPLPLINVIAMQATLILCPQRLQQQWVDEMIKFVGDYIEIWQVRGESCVCEKNALKLPKIKVLSITSRHASSKSASLRSRGEFIRTEFIRTFPLVTVDMLQKFDVVITPIELMDNKLYIESVKHVMEKCTPGCSTTDMMAGMKKSFETDKVAATSRLAAAPFPVLQAFWWHRIIIDEFHESVVWEFRPRELVKEIGATHRWGLSGTPPLHTSVAVTEVAKLLWYPQKVAAPMMKLWIMLEQTRGQKLISFVESHGLALEMEALAFLNNCVRQNSTKLVDDIEVVYHIKHPAYNLFET